MKQDIREEITRSIVDFIETNGDLPWRKPWIGGGSMDMPKRVTGENYRGINVLTCWIAQMEHGFRSSVYMTYKQAVALGGSVKGQKACAPIVFYKPLKIKDRETGEEKTIPMMKYYRVFNVDQITGLPDHWYESAKAVEPINKGCRSYEIDNFLRDTGAYIREHGTQAFYDRAADTIAMPCFGYFTDANSYYSTLFHELIHWTGAPDRLDRVKGKQFGDKDYSFEELVAELGAVFTCAEFGVYDDSRKADSAAYLQSWLRGLKNDSTFIFKASAKSNQAVSYLDKLTGRVAETAAV